MPYGVSGGQFEQYVHQALFDAVADILDAHGWRDAGHWWEPITLVPEPVVKGEKIPENTVGVLLEDRVASEIELGSNWAELQWTFYIDGWVANRDALMQIRGDIAEGLSGRDEAFTGRGAPVLEIYDYGAATPGLLVVGELDEIEEASDATPQTPWQQTWFSVTGFIQVG